MTGKLLPVLIVAALLVFGRVNPAVAAETCTAKSIDGIGKCHHRAFAQRIVDQQIRGMQDAPPAAPQGIDANLLATRLAGTFAVGEWFPLSRRPSYWILVVRQGEVGLPPMFRVQPIFQDAGVLTIALVKIEASRTPRDAGKPLVTIIASTASLRPVAGNTLRCIDPEPDVEGGGDSEDLYRDFGGFRWLTLSARHRVIAATVSRSEGYAGGGGTFSREVLLEQRNGRLVAIACYAVSRYQMFGGNWNPNGTREHPESQAAWVLRPVGRGEWPRLRVQATTTRTRSASLTWNPSTRWYE